MSFVALPAFIAVALLIYAVVIYNRLVADRNRVSAAWSDIDVQLKRRHDLVPKLVDTVRAYAAYEQAALTHIAELRNRAVQISDIEERARTEGELGHDVRQLLALAESYPDLKASENFLDLQHKLAEVEDGIQFARRYYNGSVRNFNTRIESFPDLFIARTFAFKPAAFFEHDQ